MSTQPVDQMPQDECLLELALRFKMLQVKCPSEALHRKSRAKTWPGDRCKGRGWAPVSGDAVVVALLEVLWSMGWIISCWCDDSVAICPTDETAIAQGIPIKDVIGEGRGGEALARALVKAVRQEAR